MEDIRLGSTVLVNSKHKAVVKYIGPTAFAEGIWYGLELEREIGKHEGTVLGHTYFVTAKKRGTFVKLENLTIFDSAVQAASSIQSVGRMTLAKRKVKQEITWRTFNTLDADDEAQHLQRQIRLSNTILGSQLSRDHPSASTLDQWEKEILNHVPLESDYDGPHLTFPITRDQVLTMMEYFRNSKLLHIRYAIQLVNAYRRYITSLPTLLEISVEDNETLTICGDTHGQLQDLYTIYSLNGLPSLTNRYLMNGDFVDRGEYGCEILFTIMAWSLLYPGELLNNNQTQKSTTVGSQFLKGAACMLNRGNHETHAQNLTGGFMLEVLNKYSITINTNPTTPNNENNTIDIGLRLYDTIQSAFDNMPLATLITKEHKRVFVVHGGLLHRPGVTLSQIAAVKRKRDIPYGLPAFEDKLFEDLMWSDPRSIVATTPSDRGAGVFFGSDVTENFCSTNRISLVVRSHECVPEGFLYMHGDRLVTIFSASRYCGRGTNRGAILQLDSNLDASIRQFVATDLNQTQPTIEHPNGYINNDLEYKFNSLLAVDHAHLATVPDEDIVTTPNIINNSSSFSPNNNAVSSTGKIDAAAQTAQAEAVRKMLMERICLRKPDLYFFFSAADRTGNKDGHVTKVIWADGMRTVLDLELPWISLCPMLAEIEPDGRINYTKFLDRYRIAMRDSDLEWMENITEQVCRRVFMGSSNLEETFKAWDEDHSGSIEIDELEIGLIKLNLGLTKSQIYEIMNVLDTDKDGHIQYSEFTARFQLSFSRMKDDSVGSSSSPMPTMDNWTISTINKVGSALFKGEFGNNAPAVFSSIDTNGDGLLSEEEFITALHRLNLGLTDNDLKRVMRVVDANGSGKINYLEFVTAFKVHDTKTSPLHTQVPTWSVNTDKGNNSPILSPKIDTDKDATLVPRLPVYAPHTSKLPVIGSESTSLSTSGDNNTTPISSSNWQRGVIEKIIAVLYEYRVELAAAFSMFDTDRSGRISSKEFRVGLQALTSLTSSPLTDMQADELLKVLDTNGDGEIDWQEFVGAFKLVDMNGNATNIGNNTTITGNISPSSLSSSNTHSNDNSVTSTTISSSSSNSPVHGTGPSIVNPNIDVGRRNF